MPLSEKLAFKNQTPYLIDLHLNTMFRCPLQSCESHLNTHYQIYRKKHYKQFIFLFQTEFGWKEVNYPPI